MGNGSLGVLQRHAELFGIDAICVSHLHTDHCIDLSSYWVARQYAPDGPQPAIPVYGPGGTIDRVAGVCGEDTAHIASRFDVRELTQTQEIGPFRVSTERMNHPVETFGFRIEHAGRTLAYSADTGPTDALIRLAHGVDLLLSEASFQDGRDNPPDLHLTARQAGEHATQAGAGQLVLTHLVPWYDRDRSLAEAAGSYCGPLSAATSGLVLRPGAAR
jgi:ribonuclease BN (tRNA processing enzyme)